MIEPFKDGLNGFQARQKLNDIVDHCNNTERLQLSVVQMITGLVAIVTLAVIVVSIAII